MRRRKRLIFVEARHYFSFCSFLHSVLKIREGTIFHVNCTLVYRGYTRSRMEIVFVSWVPNASSNGRKIANKSLPMLRRFCILGFLFSLTAFHRVFNSAHRDPFSEKTISAVLARQHFTVKNQQWKRKQRPNHFVYILCHVLKSYMVIEPAHFIKFTCDSNGTQVT